MLLLVLFYCWGNGGSKLAILHLARVITSLGVDLVFKPKHFDSKIHAVNYPLHCKVFGTVNNYYYYYYYFFKKILFIFREGKGGWKRGKHQCVVASWVPPTGDLARNPGMCPTGNQTRDPLVCRSALIALSHTSQGILLLQLLLTFIVMVIIPQLTHHVCHFRWGNRHLTSY